MKLTATGHSPEFNLEVYELALRLPRPRYVHVDLVHDAYCDWLLRDVRVPNAYNSANYILMAARRLQGAERHHSWLLSTNMRLDTNLTYEDRLVEALDGFAARGRTLARVLQIRQQADERARTRNQDAKTAYRQRKSSGEVFARKEGEPHFHNDQWQSDLATIRHLVELGFSKPKLAEELGKSCHVVRAWVAGEVVPTERSGLAIRELARRFEAGEVIGPRSLYKKADREAILRLHAEGKTIVEISRALGSARKYVERLHRQMGLAYNPITKRAIDRARVAVLRGQGFTTSQIAEILGFSPITVRSALRPPRRVAKPA